MLRRNISDGQTDKHADMRGLIVMRQKSDWSVKVSGQKYTSPTLRLDYIFIFIHCTKRYETNRLLSRRQRLFTE